MINGSKYWCTFADGADYLMLFARTGQPEAGQSRHRGISAFIVPEVTFLKYR